MWSYIIRRLLYALPTALGVMVLTFLLFNVVRGDASAEMAGKSASPETIAEIRRAYGWDKPLWLNVEAVSERGIAAAFDSQFFHHLRKCVTFQFGDSWRAKRPISTILAEGAMPSLHLTLPMFVVGIVTSLVLSMGVAFFRGRAFDIGMVLLCVVGMSIPFLSYILFGQYYFAYKLQWFPVFGYESGLEGAQYLVLPVLIGVISGLGGQVRFYRTVFLDEIHADYVRTARSKGLAYPRVLFKHVFKNAMIPIITQVVLSIPFLFLGSLLLERFFGIPGLGYLTIEAIGSRDFPVISAITYISALLYLVALIVTDICYALVDPRVTFE